jgi:hypothetical protein
MADDGRNLARGLTQRAAVALVCAMLAPLALAGCGGDEEEAEDPDIATPSTREPSSPKPDHRPEPPPQGDEDGAVGTAREVTRQVRRYVGGLSDGDGALVCSLLVPGALEAIELPRPRGGCAASLAASIGYRDPRGFPVFESAAVEDAPTTVVDGSDARVTATVVTTFADRDEPSVEDDVIYVTREGGSWLIVKPSAVLYRAIGVADIPPNVLAPP